MKRPKITRSQLVTHIFLMIGGWGLYVYGLIQLQTVPSHAYQAVFIVLVLEMVFLIGLTVSWIIHHLSIHKKFGPRMKVTPALWIYEKDWLGYKVEGNFEVLKQHQVIIVTCHSDTKIKTFEPEKKKYD